jgi:hypothetical protein
MTSSGGSRLSLPRRACRGHQFMAMSLKESSRDNAASDRAGSLGSRQKYVLGSTVDHHNRQSKGTPQISASYTIQLAWAQPHRFGIHSSNRAGTNNTSSRDRDFESPRSDNHLARNPEYRETVWRTETCADYCLTWGASLVDRGSAPRSDLQTTQRGVRDSLFAGWYKLMLSCDGSGGSSHPRGADANRKLPTRGQALARPATPKTIRYLLLHLHLFGFAEIAAVAMTP